MSTNSLETEVALLKKETIQMNQIFNKLDTAIDKLSTAASDISRILAVHEEKINSHDKIDTELFDLIEIRRKEMSEDIKELNTRINTIQKELANDISSTEQKIMTALVELKKDISANKNSIESDNSELEDRIDSLEKWRWFIMGGGAVVGFIASKFSTFVEFITK
jgi:DNA repair exonuclease SbcCD ATPase subunit